MLALETLWAPLGVLGTLLGRPCGGVGRVLRALGPSWGALGALLGPCWGYVAKNMSQEREVSLFTPPTWEAKFKPKSIKNYIKKQPVFKHVFVALVCDCWSIVEPIFR